jgi:hypothetical protein
MVGWEHLTQCERGSCSLNRVVCVCAVIPFAGASTATPCLAVVGLAVVVAIVNACQCSTTQTSCPLEDAEQSVDSTADSRLSVKHDHKREGSQTSLLCASPPTT